MRREGFRAGQSSIERRASKLLTTTRIPTKGLRYQKADVHFTREWSR